MTLSPDVDQHPDQPFSEKFEAFRLKGFPAFVQDLADLLQRLLHRELP
jgi:hypothetical protein